jgi:hypothetical protein
VQRQRGNLPQRQDLRLLRGWLERPQLHQDGTRQISTIFSPMAFPETNANMGLAHLPETRSRHGATHACGVSYRLAEL